MQLLGPTVECEASNTASGCQVNNQRIFNASMYFEVSILTSFFGGYLKGVWYEATRTCGVRQVRVVWVPGIFGRHRELNFTDPEPSSQTKATVPKGFMWLYDLYINPKL